MPCLASTSQAVASQADDAAKSQADCLARQACKYGGGLVLSEGLQQKYGEFLFSRSLYGYENPLQTLRNPLGGKAK